MRKRNIGWDKEPLGQEPDSHIARRLGVTASAVCTARLGRGIPAFMREKNQNNSDIVTLRVRPPMLDRFKDLAQRRREPVSVLMRKVLQAYLDLGGQMRDEKQMGPDERLRDRIKWALLEGGMLAIGTVLDAVAWGRRALRRRLRGDGLTDAERREQAFWDSQSK